MSNQPPYLITRTYFHSFYEVILREYFSRTCNQVPGLKNVLLFSFISCYIFKYYTFHCY